MTMISLWVIVIIIWICFCLLKTIISRVMLYIQFVMDMIVKGLLIKPYFFSELQLWRCGVNKQALIFLVWSFWGKKKKKKKLSLALWKKSILPNKSPTEKAELVCMISMKKSQYFLVWFLRKKFSLLPTFTTNRVTSA